MKIENYNRKLEEEKTTGGNLFSDPHMIQGFKMRLLIYLNGCGGGEGTHLSLFFQLMKGELDDILKWPFNKTIHFVLIHQDNKNECFKLSITDTEKATTTAYFRKPVTDFNIGFGYIRFISHERLHAGGFIKNDSLYIGCTIE